jgi:hypothetical protein
LSAIVGVITNNPVTPTDVVGDNTNNGENDNTNNGENGNTNNGENYGALHLRYLVPDNIYKYYGALRLYR